MDETTPETENPAIATPAPYRGKMAPQAKPESRYTPEQNCLGCVITLVVVLVAFGIAVAYYLIQNPEFHGR
jgi:hypothetical protein